MSACTEFKVGNNNRLHCVQPCSFQDQKVWKWTHTEFWPSKMGTFT